MNCKFKTEIPTLYILVILLQNNISQPRNAYNNEDNFKYLWLYSHYIYTIHLLNCKKQTLLMFVFFILGNKMASSYNSYMRTKGAPANNKELLALFLNTI